jgi:hypothetical protein
MSNVFSMPLANRCQDLLDELNNQFGIVVIGGTVCVVHEFDDPRTGRPKTEFLSLPGFRELLRNRPSPVHGKSAATFWLDHPQRRQFITVDFIPGRSPAGVYNLWYGFPYEPKQGDTRLFWSFVREVICAGNEETYGYLQKWLAHLIQRTTELPGTAIVLRGKQGTGKNTFADTIAALLEPHSMTVTNIGQVTGRFTGHFANKIFVHANEATWGGNKQEEGNLKAMITDTKLPMEFKGRDMIEINNYRRLVISSNEDWVVPRGLEDRRFLVLDVSDRHMQDREYFAKLKGSRSKSGLEALMFDLKDEDLSNFDPGKLPATSAGTDMKLKSADSVTRFVHNFLHEKEAVISYVLAGEPIKIEYESAGFDAAKDKIYCAYSRHCEAIERNKRPEPASEFFKKLNNILPDLGHSRPTIDGQRVRMLAFMPLADARLSFEKYMKQEGRFDWGEVDE